MSGLTLLITSAGRPQNVPLMHAHQFPGKTVWSVPEADLSAYLAAGANAVPTGSTEGLAKARNGGLDHVWGASPETYVAMVDDDLQWIKRATKAEPKNTVEPISITEALLSMARRLRDAELGLIGAAPTTNAFFMNRTTSVNLFARSGVWVLAPTDLRLDESLRVKEDYDFCLQQWQRHGSWLRADDMLFNFKQRSPDGAAHLREDGAEWEAVEYLIGKWPGLVKPHATREHEVSLTVPKPRRAK